jgi:hypothetical protein
MTITASDFRDSHLNSLLIGYDWERSEHFAQLTLMRPDSSEQTYRIEGLTSWSAFEDFGAQHIERCTLVAEQQGGVYLCLDPYSEGERSPQDNFWFIGARALEGAGANNSFKPKPLRGSA